jgi:hypothetical protein
MAIRPNDKHSRSVPISHPSLQLAIIARLRNPNNQDNITLILLPPQNGAELSVDRARQARRIPNKFYDSPKTLSEERRAPILTNRSLRSVSDPRGFRSWDVVVRVC